MSVDVETRPVGPEEMPDLSQLFGSQRTTRHCWCMAFCRPRPQFTAGWISGGNKRRFAELAASSSTPMGILAVQDGEPVGWCACGPRWRYAAATSPRSTAMPHRLPAEDESVWLIPCVFVRSGRRGQGVTHALVQAAVDLARREGAAAVEGWPLAQSAQRPADAFLGREELFAELGFRSIDRPSTERVVMRLELRGAGS